MSVDCMPEVVRTRRQYPAAPPKNVSKNAYLGDFLLIDELKREKREDPVTARKTGSSVWSVELYFGIDFCFWLLYKNFIQKLTL